MAKNKGKSNFIIQGSILAVAGILVRVIGLVYRVPLNNILGNSGISAYATAYDVYSLFLLISSLSLLLQFLKSFQQGWQKSRFAMPIMHLSVLWYWQVL